MFKSSSSLPGGRHKLPLTALAVIYQTDVWSFSRPCGLPCRFLFLPYDINDFFWGISCQQTGRRRALVTIVNGSTERAKTRKICSSQHSSSPVQAYQHLPRMMPPQLSTNPTAATYLREPAGGAEEYSEDRTGCGTEADTANSS